MESWPGDRGEFAVPIDLQLAGGDGGRPVPGKRRWVVEEVGGRGEERGSGHRLGEVQDPVGVPGGSPMNMLCSIRSVTAGSREYPM